MNRRRHRIVGAALIRAGWLCGSWLTLTSWVAQASPADPAQALVAERNALLLKLFRDEDSAGTIPALKRLYEQRARLQTSAVQQEEAQQKRNAELALYQKSLDYDAAWYCRLAVDPRQPRGDRYQSLDWGRVLRKTEVPLATAPDNVLADASVTIYEVEGQSQRYLVDASDNPSFQAAVGDLVALCRYKQSTRSDLPAPWSSRTLTSSKYSGRIARPPRIVDKRAWNPIHITDQELRNAILDRRWETPPDRYVVALVRVEKELGSGRFAMLSRYWQDPFLLEVPAGLPRVELLKAGEFVWIILGKPRFDREQGKLVLVAADIELRYLVDS